METERPSLNFYDPVSQEQVSLYFGYLSNEAMMPIYKGDEMVVMVPREVLIIALQDGWGSQESGWWVDPSKN